MVMAGELPTFCAWHQKYHGSDLQMTGPPPGPDQAVSHGICDECCRILMDEQAALTLNF